MTKTERQKLKDEIDAKVRERVANGEIVAGEVVIFEEEVETAIADSEEAKRAALLWRDQPWRLFTRCTRHGDMAYCAGPTRDSVICLRCYLEAPSKRRRKTMSGNNNKTSAVSLRAPFLEALMERVSGLTAIEKVAYVRVVEGKRTVAYVNGDRKLKIDVPASGGGLDSFKIASTGEFEPALLAIASFTAPREETPESVVEAPPAPATAAKPDPKPRKRTRSRRRKVTA